VLPGNARASVPRSGGIESVFLNIPYDDAFENLYLAYIVGLTQLGLRINATLAIFIWFLSLGVVPKIGHQLLVSNGQLSSFIGRKAWSAGMVARSL